MAKESSKKPQYTCRHCRNCTPYMKFNTLSIDGKPTMGTCPYWTASKCVLLSLDYCDHFDIRDEYSGITETQKALDMQKDRDLQRKKEVLEKMREEFTQNNQVVLPTLPYGKQKNKKRK